MSWLFEALASPKSTVPRRPAVEEIEPRDLGPKHPSSARRNPYEARRALAGAWSSGNAADALANATRFRPRGGPDRGIRTPGRYHPYGVDPSFSAYKTPARARASPLGTDDGSDPLLSNFLRRGIDPPGARTAPPNPAAPAPAWASSRWRGADGVGALHRPPATAARKISTGAPAGRKSIFPHPAPRFDADRGLGLEDGIVAGPQYLPARYEVVDLTFEESARKSGEMARRANEKRRAALRSPVPPATRRGPDDADDRPAEDATPANTRLAFYTHGPKPANDATDLATEAARVAAAAASRIRSTTPQAATLRRRALYRPAYDVAAARAAVADPRGETAADENDDAPGASGSGRGFGGSMRPSQLRAFRAFDDAAGLVDLPALREYRARVAAAGGSNSRTVRATANPFDDALAKVRGDVDPATEAARRATEAKANAARRAADALGKLRADEIALDARAADAVSSPAAKAREADIARQIEALSVESAELAKRREGKTGAFAEADEEAEAEDPESRAAAAELLAPLTRDQLDLVAEAVAPGPSTQVVASGTFTGQGTLEVTRKDVGTMAPGEWLNDEMVNFTIGTMADREMARRGGKQPKVHFFNTFFVKKMCDGDEGYNYNAVRRWTTKKKLGYDLLECEKLVIPVHQGIHWVLAVVDLTAKKIVFYDSLLGGDKGLVEHLKRWVRDEYQNKREVAVETSGWTAETPKNIPKQMNGCDCGVFMLKYADYVAVGAPFAFSQEHMGYFRRRIIADAMAQGLN